ncbi:2157_t:CDS:2 [Funneliformis caledonium]|uniref:2157_t:CDS:1 n=1 Tax=Funneliformis caledonium TaxID=1117310 RepID=A0A9N9GLD7_9GLOM|nr:2157_t:CDS:2 [Funneliformis caledonium]
MTLPTFTEHTEINGKSVNSMLTLAESYNKSVQEESTMTPEQLKTRYVGKQVQKRHLEENLEDIILALGIMIDSDSFIDTNQKNKIQG